MVNFNQKVWLPCGLILPVSRRFPLQICLTCIFPEMLLAPKMPTTPTPEVLKQLKTIPENPNDKRDTTFPAKSGNISGLGALVVHVFSDGSVFLIPEIYASLDQLWGFFRSPVALYIVASCRQKNISCVVWHKGALSLDGKALDMTFVVQAHLDGWLRHQYFSCMTALRGLPG